MNHFISETTPRYRPNKDGTWTRIGRKTAIEFKLEIILGRMG